ncbi:MAG: hypothetical protein UY98_C0032G0010 [Candidatus Kaiserbacteria bacterium GW2011_GWA2_58_9]|uniref:Uncharacterized protein n=1 Tax=Candidatus Kaiserbacteria bacterium GW2011_GWA2_58_9 TaxID=1618672 RepID=A0A0G2BK34_9BACT|nr:MAG: hypothetical protein UY98_C0032G0010 [Candidatus Kaiserbacteria bacterium GW2011_GWA2_58_9]
MLIMDRLGRNNDGTETVVSFERTKAMRHPHWKDAVGEIELRFRLTDELKKWAIDATSARLMDDHGREEKALVMLGEVAANDLRAIWNKWDINQSEKNAE